MNNKTKRSHPLSALDRHSESSPEDKPVSTDDKRIDASNAFPYEKCCERYVGDLTKQSKAFDESQHRQRRAQKYLNYLGEEIKHGYVNGLNELAFIAYSATQMLEKLAKHEPDYVSIVAQSYGTWPTLRMLNSPDKDERALLKKIHLDYRNIDGLPTHMIGRDPRPTRAWAFRLIKVLQDYRRAATKDDLPTELFWNFMIMSGGESSKTIHELREHPDLCNQCLQLRPFGTNTEPQWWKLAEQLLLRISDEKPWTLEGLNTYANSKKVQKYAETTDKVDGVKRDAVLKS